MLRTTPLSIFEKRDISSENGSLLQLVRSSFIAVPFSKLRLSSLSPPLLKEGEKSLCRVWTCIDRDSIPWCFPVENRQEGGGAGGGRDKRERGLKSALREKRISSLVDGALFRGPSVVPLPPSPPGFPLNECDERAGKKKKRKREILEKSGGWPAGRA